MKKIVHQSFSEYCSDYVLESSISNTNNERMTAIAYRFGISLDMVMLELERGVKIELKYTDSKQIALRNALDNIKKDICYYSNMEKLDKEIKNKKRPI